MNNRKDPHAAALGHRGGLARFSKLSPLQRSHLGQKAAKARWAKSRESLATGKFLPLLRLRKRWSQRQLAERSGVSKSEIIRLEAGKVSPRWFTVVRLAKALEVDEKTLLEGGNG